MAYGDKYKIYRKGGKTYAKKKSSKKSKPASIYKKEVPVTVQKAANINAAKIKQVEQKLINGKVQRGYHIIRIPQLPGMGFTFSTSEPLLFCLNDFYTQTNATANGCVYYPNYSGVAPNVDMTSVIVDRWQDFLPAQNAGFLPKYSQWKDAKIAQPSNSGYQPIYTDLSFTVTRERATAAQGTLWIRLDVFKAKRTFVSTNSLVNPKNYTLPGCVGALSNMAVGHNVNFRNSFNPALWHHVQKTRWIRLKAVTQDSENLMTNFHVRCKFNKEFLKLNQVVNSAGNGEEFWTLVDKKTPVWLLMSISNNPVDADNSVPQIAVTRKTIWRDSRGTEM